MGDPKLTRPTQDLLHSPDFADFQKKMQFTLKLGALLKSLRELGLDIPGIDQSTSLDKYMLTISDKPVQEIAEIYENIKIYGEFQKSILKFFKDTDPNLRTEILKKVKTDLSLIKEFSENTNDFIQKQENFVHDIKSALNETRYFELNEEEKTKFTEILNRQNDKNYILKTILEKGFQYLFEIMNQDLMIVTDTKEIAKNRFLKTEQVKLRNELAHWGDPDHKIPGFREKEFRTLLEKLAENRLTESGLYNLNDLLRDNPDHSIHHTIGDDHDATTPKRIGDILKDFDFSDSTHKSQRPITEPLHTGPQGAFKDSQQEGAGIWKIPDFGTKDTHPQKEERLDYTIEISPTKRSVLFAQDTKSGMRHSEINFPKGYEGTIISSDENATIFELKDPSKKDKFIFTFYKQASTVKTHRGARKNIWLEVERIHESGANLKTFHTLTKRTNPLEELNQIINDIEPLQKYEIKVKENTLIFKDAKGAELSLQIPEEWEVTIAAETQDIPILRLHLKDSGKDIFIMVNNDYSIEYFLYNEEALKITNKIITTEETILKELEGLIKKIFHQSKKQETAPLKAIETPVPTAEADTAEDEELTDPTEFEPHIEPSPEVLRTKHQQASSVYSKEQIRLLIASNEYDDPNKHIPRLENQLDIETSGDDAVLLDHASKTYAVFDGVTTVQGSDIFSVFCAEFVKNNILNYIPETETDPEKIMAGLKNITDDLINGIESGNAPKGASTASIVVERGERVYCAYLGDSPVFVYNPFNRMKNRLERLTLDDNPIMFLFEDFPQLQKKIQRDYDEYQGDTSSFSEFRLPLVNTDRFVALADDKSPIPEPQRDIVKQILQIIDEAEAQGTGFIDPENSRLLLGLAFRLNNIVGPMLGTPSAEFRFSSAKFSKGSVLMLSSDGTEGLTRSENIEAIESSNDAYDIIYHRTKKICEILQTKRFRKKFDDVGQAIIQKETAKELLEEYLEEIVATYKQVQHLFSDTQLAGVEFSFDKAQSLQKEGQYYEALRFAHNALVELGQLNGMEIPSLEQIPEPENKDIYLNLENEIQALTIPDRTIALQLCQNYTYASTAKFLENFQKLIAVYERLSTPLQSILEKIADLTQTPIPTELKQSAQARSLEQENKQEEVNSATIKIQESLATLKKLYAEYKTFPHKGNTLLEIEKTLRYILELNKKFTTEKSLSKKLELLTEAQTLADKTTKQLEDLITEQKEITEETRIPTKKLKPSFWKNPWLYLGSAVVAGFVLVADKILNENNENKNIPATSQNLEPVHISAGDPIRDAGLTQTNSQTAPRDATIDSGADLTWELNDTSVAEPTSNYDLGLDASVIPDAAKAVPDLPLTETMTTPPAPRSSEYNEMPNIVRDFVYHRTETPTPKVTPIETPKPQITVESVLIKPGDTTIGLVVKTLLEKEPQLNKIDVRRAVAQFALANAAHSSIKEGNSLQFDYSITPEGKLRINSIEQIKTTKEVKAPTQTAETKIAPQNTQVETKVEKSTATDIHIGAHTYKTGDIIEYIPLASQPGKYKIVGLSEDGKAVLLKNADKENAPQFAVNLKNAESRVLSPETRKFSIDGLRFEMLPGDAYNVHFTTLSGKGVIEALATLILHTDYTDDPTKLEKARERSSETVRAADKEGHIVDTFDPTIEYIEIPDTVLSTDSFVVAWKNNQWVIESAHFSRGKAKKIPLE